MNTTFDLPSTSCYFTPFPLTLTLTSPLSSSSCPFSSFIPIPMLQHYLLPTLPLPFPFLLLLLVLYFLHYLTPYIHDLGFSKNPHKVYIVNWFKSHSFPSWIKLRTVSLCIHSFVLVHLSLPHLGYFLFCDFIEKDRGKNEDFKKRNTNPPSSLYSYPKGSDQDVKRVMKVLRRDSWKCNELRKMHTTTTTTTMKENHEEKEKINKLDIVFNPHQLEEERRGQTPIQNEENEGGQPMDSEEDKENENVEEEEDEEEDEEEEEEEDSDMEEDDENDQDEAVEDDEEEEDEENGEEDDDEDDDEEEDDEDEEEDEENENENENEVEEDDEDENEEDEHGRLENGLEATDKGVKNDVEEEDEDEDDDDDDDDEERNGNEGEGEGDEEDEEEEEVLGMIDFSEFPILDPETDAIRKEAMESLREIEQSFQRLRLALFDERMGHLRLEEIHIKEGTHPDYLLRLEAINREHELKNERALKHRTFGIQCAQNEFNAVKLHAERDFIDFRSRTRFQRIREIYRLIFQLKSEKRKLESTSTGKHPFVESTLGPHYPNQQILGQKRKRMKAFAQDLKSIQYFYGRPVLDLDPLSPSDIQSDLKAILPQSSLPQIMYQNPHSLLYHEQFFHPGDYVLVSEYSTQSKYPGQLFSISEHEIICLRNDGSKARYGLQQLRQRYVILEKVAKFSST